MTTRWRWSPRRKWAPAAWPTRSAVSAVIGSRLVVPRIPSVPKNLRVIARLLAAAAVEALDTRRIAVWPRLSLRVHPGCGWFRQLRLSGEVVPAKLIEMHQARNEPADRYCCDADADQPP